ncbi:unnamed protein product, partial [Iphiclides podalirius]
MVAEPYCIPANWVGDATGTAAIYVPEGTTLLSVKKRGNGFVAADWGKYTIFSRFRDGPSRGWTLTCCASGDDGRGGNVYPQRDHQGLRCVHGPRAAKTSKEAGVLVVTRHCRSSATLCRCPPEVSTTATAAAPERGIG